MTELALRADEIFYYIQSVELPARKKTWAGVSAPGIMRYGAFVGSSIECHPTLTRTMDYARASIDSLEKKGQAVHNGRIILARSLTGSKGRFTRTWHAPSGGLWGCLIHANTLMPQSAMLLSLAVGSAACEAVRQAGLETAAIRWVNDILADGLKLAGFLIESHTSLVYREPFHLVGFGFNVNNTRFPHEIRDTASSLCRQLGHPLDLHAFALNFIGKLVYHIGLLHAIEAQQADARVELTETLHPVIRCWKNLSDSVGKRVVFGNDVMQLPLYSGTVTGIGRQGGLEISLEDGTSITEHSGEIRYL